MMRFACVLFFAAALSRATPVTVVPVSAAHGMVVAGHPQAAAAGVAILKSGGNAIDAAVAVSLALGVAEPYASGLGGKLMLLHYEAATRRTTVIEAMDAAGSLAVAKFLKRPVADRSLGYGSVCVPGLAAGLWAAHQKWGAKKWADDVAPAIALARDGFLILPKTLDAFEEQAAKLHGPDAELARLYLPGGELPAVGSRLKNTELAHTMELLAAHGRDGFYRGEIAEKISAASRLGGGALTPEDFSRYEARVDSALAVDFRGFHLAAAPPPASGPALFLTILKVLEDENFSGSALRTAENLDKVGRAWRVVQSLVARAVGDAPESRFAVEKLLAPDSIRALREKMTAAAAAPAEKVAFSADPFADESPMAATTHFIVVDAAGNIVCATQSQSLHFGAGVIAPGTGIVLNDSMSNFSYTDPRSPNYIAPGRRPRSTISPTIVFRGGRPVFALGIPGAARIPTAMVQVLLDRLALGRPLAEAIGDTRMHFSAPARRDEAELFEAEASLPAAVADGLRARGWRVVLPEAAGRGRHFGGLNAIECNADGTLTGYADPRRTNAAVGW